MEKGIVTITVWYNDLQDIDGLPVRFESLLNAGNIKIIEMHRSYMRVSGKEHILTALYKG